MAKYVSLKEYIDERKIDVSVIKGREKDFTIINPHLIPHNVLYLGDNEFDLVVNLLKQYKEQVKEEEGSHSDPYIEVYNILSEIGIEEDIEEEELPKKTESTSRGQLIHTLTHTEIENKWFCAEIRHFLEKHVKLPQTPITGKVPAPPIYDNEGNKYNAFLRINGLFSREWYKRFKPPEGCVIIVKVEEGKIIIFPT